MRTNLTL